ncbi:MAG: threonine--tRNA ligase [Acidobacteria bacterium]|nr:threonine--tRNA ligase [Acidobacteriota bacterium]NIM61007.1 threonine--tRNA ligase [Acidobacteriota bacterium]NIO59975.1 threonine--tRNA ligase [Acidobacteriota bacterium]NIQ31047.1 threonine--tRNA ligase [Acidobacteriota bacterium]NIQ86175.1 threonine--tRNA ligase [Acidobacteriota bacterium]
MSQATTEIRVTLPDGSVRAVPPGTTPREIAAEIGPGLAKAALLARLDGQLVDLATPLHGDHELALITDRDPEALHVLRHSTAHATAQAVQELFPGTKIGQGPVIENGFYYDFDRDTPFSDADLEAIEERVAEIIKRDLAIERVDLPREEAIAFFEKEAEPYKIYFAKTKGGETVSIYRQGEWTDFCLGPHVPSTGRLGAFKLLSVAGAYWLGDEKNKMLQRIYGTAFFSKKELRKHLALLEEARKRDHRKLGKELGLFSFHPEAPASPFFHPSGASIYNRLVEHVRRLYQRYGYDEVITPQIFDSSLWKRSGHYEHYRDNMYFTEVDGREYGVKPMNCPSHCLLFGEGRHSYRELPMRIADFGRLHRYELSGATAGLTRVRSFAQDDAHIFCTPDQVRDEVAGVTRMILECYGLFGFDVKLVLSTRPDDRAGDDATWDRAEKDLKDALDSLDHEYTIAEGDGAFYGPKIDFYVKDALAREHQLGTCQLDYVLPERFELRYFDAEDQERRPVMIHRAMLGSLERFFGILIEHCGGAFPFWLAPEQVRVCSIADRHADYASSVVEQLRAGGLRAQPDTRNIKVNAKIREAQLAKIPVMLVVGDREAEQGTVAVRTRSGGDQGSSTIEAFLGEAKNWIDRYNLQP